MGIVIDEVVASVEQPLLHEGGGEGEPRPTAEQQKQSMIDLLDMMKERKARLVID